MVQLCEVSSELLQSLREEILVFFGRLDDERVRKVEDVEMVVLSEAVLDKVSNCSEIRQEFSVDVVDSNFLPNKRTEDDGASSCRQARDLPHKLW